MEAPALPPLSEWENFYVIIGSSAAALTGLMFVVIALRSEARDEGGESGYRAYASPTVAHFCAVLLVASILSMPGHTVPSLGLCVGGAGLLGLALPIRVAVLAPRAKSYTMVLSDWIWHCALPLVAYAALVGAAIALWFRPVPALDVIGAAALLILFIGIHNAWDAAVWMITSTTGAGRGGPPRDEGR